MCVQRTLIFECTMLIFRINLPAGSSLLLYLYVCIGNRYGIQTAELQIRPILFPTWIITQKISARVSLPNRNVTKLNIDDDGFVDCKTRETCLYIDIDNWHAPCSFCDFQIKRCYLIGKGVQTFILFLFIFSNRQYCHSFTFKFYIF